MKNKGLIILLITALLSFSCGSKKETVSRDREPERTKAPARVTANKAEIPTGGYADVISSYIALYADIAKEEMRIYKIPASITLAQGILESGAGRGDLSRRANNHFGIKCHDWRGEMVYHDDDKSQECFRKYEDAKYSYRDHSLFLAERRRYADLFDLDPDDYEGWAKGLRSAGYATDRQYPRKLIDLIERYQLYNYDAEVLGKGTRDVRVADRQPERYVVQKGDTLYSIAKRYNLTVEMLQKYNNLNSTNIAIGQELYVQQ